MKTNIVKSQRPNFYTGNKESYYFFVEITNSRYKTILPHDSYFCVTIKEVRDKDNVQRYVSPDVYNITRNKDIADSLRMDVYEFNYLLQKYGATSQLEGGHYFTDYNKAKEFVNEHIIPKLIVIQLAG